MNSKKVGAALRALRVAAGMTLEDLADTAGVSASYLSRVENDLVAPSSGWIELVAVAIGERMVGAA